MKYIVIAILFCIVNSVSAQDAVNTTQHINEEPAIRQMLDHRKALNFDEKRKIKAWSVQIYITRDKFLANQKTVEIKNQFTHMNQKVDWFYENPYYRLYTGSFYTKLEAASLLHQLILQYPDAYIFKNGDAKPADMM